MDRHYKYRCLEGNKDVTQSFDWFQQYFKAIHISSKQVKQKQNPSNVPSNPQFAQSSFLHIDAQ